MEAQMDTTESSQLSEIFSILEGDPTGIYNGVLLYVYSVMTVF